MHSRKAKTREAMPASADLVDSLRAAGLEIAWVRLTENGQTQEGGKRTKDKATPPIPGVMWKS